MALGWIVFTRFVLSQIILANDIFLISSNCSTVKLLGQPEFSYQNLQSSKLGKLALQKENKKTDRLPKISKTKKKQLFLLHGQKVIWDCQSSF